MKLKSSLSQSIIPNQPSLQFLGVSQCNLMMKTWMYLLYPLLQVRWNQHSVHYVFKYFIFVWQHIMAMARRLCMLVLLVLFVMSLADAYVIYRRYYAPRYYRSYAPRPIIYTDDLDDIDPVYVIKGKPIFFFSPTNINNWPVKGSGSHYQIIYC